MKKYGKYIYKVLKQVHPDLEIGTDGMREINIILNDIFDRIASEAGRLARYNKGNTIGTLEIQTAIRLVLPAELAKYAEKEGKNAVVRYNSTLN